MLRTNQGELGLRAAGTAYPEVWARDAIIAGLGIAASGSTDDLDSLRRSLRSLAAGQSRLGRIPNHVRRIDDNGALTADTIFAGAIDASLWYIIGHDVLSRAVDGTDDLASAWESLHDAHRWLEYQDANECGLLEVHESMDWRNREEWVYPTQLVDTILVTRPYYLPYMAFRDYGDRFNTLGNLCPLSVQVAEELGGVFEVGDGLWCALVVDLRSPQPRRCRQAQRPAPCR